jgi:predicted TIM-barrel fold metal-dependent hydrolase
MKEIFEHKSIFVLTKKKLKIYIDLSLIENQNNGRQRRREYHGTRKIVFGSDTPAISKP